MGSNVLGGVFEKLVGFGAVDHVIGNVSIFSNIASPIDFLPQWEE